MSDMKYGVLGASGMKVSRLCLGTMMFGAQTDEAEAARMVAHAREHGVNFLDTADVYAQGKSEIAVGKAVKGQRNRWVIATKVAQPVGPDVTDRGLSRRHLYNAVDASLQRLGTDHIDLYYIHRVDPDTRWEQTIQAFGDLIRQGKIREWALSNVRAWHIPHIWHLCRQLGTPAPVALQPYYNLMNRQPEVDVLPAAKAFDLGVVPYSPIARGILTGKYKVNQKAEPGSRAARNDKRMMEAEWRPESLLIAEKLQQALQQRGVSMVHWAVAWVLNNAAITSSIAGPRTFEQWSGYLGALDYAWTHEDEALANSLVPPGHASAHGHSDPEYPIEGRFPRVA